MSSPQRRSPLAHRQTLTGDQERSHIRELFFVGKLILRTEAGLGVGPVKLVTGLELPIVAGGVSADGARNILWLGPDEWLITCDDLDAAALHAGLGGALKNVHHQIADVSDYYTTIRLAGAEARDMLSKLTTLDMHPKVFAVGRCAGSIFGKANAWLYLRRDDEENGPEFDLHVRWSMADYLWCALSEAGREYGFAHQSPIGQVPVRA